MASTRPRAGRYARALVIASNASATCTMRAPSGMSCARSQTDSRGRPVARGAARRSEVRCEERHQPQDSRAERRVSLDLLVLLSRQRRRFAKDRVAEPDLSDVVKERAQAKHVELGLGQSGSVARSEPTGRLRVRSGRLRYRVRQGPLQARESRRDTPIAFRLQPPVRAYRESRPGAQGECADVAIYQAQGCARNSERSAS